MKISKCTSVFNPQGFLSAFSAQTSKCISQFSRGWSAISLWLSLNKPLECRDLIECAFGSKASLGVGLDVVHLTAQKLRQKGSPLASFRTQSHTHVGTRNRSPSCHVIIVGHLITTSQLVKMKSATFSLEGLSLCEGNQHFKTHQLENSFII